MVFKPDIDETGPAPGPSGVPNGSGLGGGGVPPAATTTPNSAPAPAATGDGGAGPAGSTDAEHEAAAREAIVKLRTALLDAETEMAVAKRTILRKNAEINKLEDQIRLGGNDLTLATRLAAAEQERDEARKEVADLTVKLGNSAGVLAGDLLVSYTQSFIDWADQLDRNTESLREVNL